MKELAMAIIREYIDTYLFEPAINWPRYEFNVRSYSRWAAYEILGRISCCIFECNPIRIISEFVDEMDEYLEMSVFRDVRLVYSTAKETAEELGALFV